MSFKHMECLINCKGGNIRQNKINDGKLLMKNQFDKDVSYSPDFYLWSFGVSKEDMRNIPIKTFYEKYSLANGIMLKFNTLIDDTIQVGDVLYNSDKDTYWICTEYYDRDGILGAGKLTRCNYWIKWQDENAKIYEYPVFEINSTQYNSGESGDKTITLGSSQHLVTITADENTILLDHGKRVFWDRNTKNPTVFKITQNDTTAMNYDKGLLKITIAEDERNPNRDSIENWLCDYYEVSEVTILYDGQSTIRAGGTKTLMVDTDKTVVWSVKGDIAAEIIPAGNSAKIKCPNNQSYINKEIIVKAVVEEAEDICKLTVTGGV